MVDADIVISSLIAQAPLMALAVVVLYYTLEKRIDGVKYELERRIEGVDRKIEGVREELNGRVEGVKAELGGRISGLKGMVEELIRDVSLLALRFTTIKIR